MKKSSYTIWNQTHDLPVCSAVPQPLRHRVSPRTVLYILILISVIYFRYTTHPIFISGNSEGSKKPPDDGRLLPKHVGAHRPRNHTLYDIPPIRSVFQVTQSDPRTSLMMADYCRKTCRSLYIE
jgi:hypothetical protein